MELLSSIKIKSVLNLYEVLPEDERIIVDVLRQIIIENLPITCKEKISYNVPFFYGRKGICIVWPATIPRGGIKEGVLLGFWHGNKLIDSENYLTHGSNKQIFYKVFKRVEEIDEAAIVKLLKESVRVDALHGLKKKLWMNLLPLTQVNHKFKNKMKMIPILKCRDMKESILFYTTILDFELKDPDDTPESYVINLKNGDAEIQLSILGGDSVYGCAVNVRVEDVDGLFKKYVSRGLDTSKKKDSPVHQGPTNQSWGMREFYVTDPDGNTLRFGKEIFN